MPNDKDGCLIATKVGGMLNDNDITFQPIWKEYPKFVFISNINNKGYYPLDGFNYAVL